MAGEWTKVPLGDLVDDIVDRRGVTPLKLGSDFTTSGFRVISAKAIKGRRVDLSADEPRFVNEATYRKWMRTPLLADDVILTSEAPLGEPAYVSSDVEWCLGQRLFGIRTKKARLHGRFLFYAFQSEHVRHDLLSRATGTTAQGVRQTELRLVRIPIPRIDEQRAIAHILGTLDDKIELNRRMSETLEAMARALFKSWFVDFDPVCAKAEGRDPGLPKPLADLFPARLVESELGEIPEGWEVGTLGDVLAQRVDRCAPSEETRAKPYVPIECIAARSLLLAEAKPGEEAQSSLSKFSKGDLLFGAMRPYFHKVAIAPFDGTTRTTVFVLQPRQTDEFAFAALLLHHAKTIEYANNHSTGSTIPYAVWQGSLEMMPIVLPSGTVRKSFEQLARPLLDRIPPAFFANRTLAAMRDALLPKLISGELRVGDDEVVSGQQI